MLLGKWKWRFLVEREALGRRVIREFFGVDGGFGPSSNIKGPHGIWCDIIKVLNNLIDIDPSFSLFFCLKIVLLGIVGILLMALGWIMDGYVDKWIWSGDASGIFQALQNYKLESIPYIPSKVLNALEKLTLLLNGSAKLSTCVNFYSNFYVHQVFNNFAKMEVAKMLALAISSHSTSIQNEHISSLRLEVISIRQISSISVARNPELSL
ncbi:hypothetical protein Tco_0458767 [Tanacetum coccineum]